MADENTQKSQSRTLIYVGVAGGICAVCVIAFLVKYAKKRSFSQSVQKRTSELQAIASDLLKAN